jgi:hypothetical protein
LFLLKFKGIICSFVWYFAADGKTDANKFKERNGTIKFLKKVVICAEAVQFIKKRRDFGSFAGKVTLTLLKPETSYIV